MRLIPRRLTYTLPESVGKILVVTVTTGGKGDVPTRLEELPPEDFLAMITASPGVRGRPMFHTLLDDRELKIYPPAEGRGVLSVSYYPAAKTA